MQIQRSTRNIAAVAAVLVLAAGFVGVSFLKNRVSASTEVQAITVEKATLSRQVTATGLTEGLNQVDVKARAAAHVARLSVTEGDDVTATAALGEYDAAEVAAQLARAESSAAQASAQAALAARRRATDPQKYVLDLASAERHLASAQLSFAQATESAEDGNAQADRSLADAQAAFDLLKVQLEQGRVTADDVKRAQEAYDYAKMAFSQNESGAVYGSAAYMADYNSVTQAQANQEKLQNALETQDKTIADQLLQARNRLDAARTQLDRLQNGGTDRQIAQAQAQLDDVAAALEQVKIQHELTRTTDQDVAAAQAAARSAEAAYQQARGDYQKEILAPVDGKVLNVYVKEGDPVAPGTPLFTIGATNELVVKAKVDEVDIGKVEVGQKARVTSSAFVGRDFEGVVSKVAPRAIREGNIAVFVAKIVVQNPEGLLRPGMSVDVEIRSEEKAAVLAVPLEAVQDKDGEQFIFVVDGNTAHRRKVTTGVTTQTQVEITDGLKEGDQVVTGPSEVLSKLKDGDLVKVK